MRFLIRLVFLPLLLAFYCFFISARPVHAAGEFEINYKVAYNIQETGTTDVVQNITLKNKTANFYADKFELKIGSTKVENVKASDETGPLQVETKFENNLTSISVKFNQKVIGEGKGQNWTLTYSSNELTTKSGQIWEVSIPRLAKSSDIGAYDATISVPISFGQLASTTPSPLSTIKVGRTQQFTFNKDQLTNSGISMLLGDKQVFSYKLKYHIENPNLTSKTETIVLPPDNNYQKIVFDKLDPPPLDVVLDADNNFIAQYKLKSKENLDIVLTGSVEVFSKPFRNITTKLTDAQKTQYTSPQRYWETDNATLHEKAQQLKTPEAIYKFVSDYLTYSQERLKDNKLDRLGALAAYNAPKTAVCTEFTDLFITLARAAGIPAREVEGYAYTQNERLRPLSLALSQGDVLHAWPEYWDDNLGWVQVDPTWGSTSGGIDYFNKLDFNHITFVQRGTVSTNPYPAGSYKKVEDLNKKYVDVNFATELPQITSTPQLQIGKPENIVSGIPIHLTINLNNIGSTSIVGGKLLLTAEKSTIENPNSYDIPILPPFSKRKFIFTIQNKSYLNKIQDRLILSYADNQISQSFETKPIYKIFFLKTFAISIFTGIFIVVSGLLLYRRTRTKTLSTPHKKPHTPKLV